MVMTASKEQAPKDFRKILERIIESLNEQKESMGHRYYYDEQTEGRLTIAIIAMTLIEMREDLKKRNSGIVDWC